MQRKAHVALRAYVIGIAIATVIYCIGMTLAVRLDRFACRPDTFFERFAVEVYDWVFLPAGWVGDIFGVETWMGSALITILMGVLWGMLLASFVFGVTLIRRKVTQHHNPELSPAAVASDEA